MLSRMKHLVFDVGGLLIPGVSQVKNPVSSAFPLREFHTHTRDILLTYYYYHIIFIYLKAS